MPSARIARAADASSGALAEASTLREKPTTLPLRNVTSHADRHGHGYPSAPAMTALWRRRPNRRRTPLATNA